jgi:hypothetical protein
LKSQQHKCLLLLKPAKASFPDFENLSANSKILVLNSVELISQWKIKGTVKKIMNSCLTLFKPRSIKPDNI